VTVRRAQPISVLLWLLQRPPDFTLLLTARPLFLDFMVDAFRESWEPTHSFDSVSLYRTRHAIGAPGRSCRKSA
jgi:hypothetical protein